MFTQTCSQTHRDTPEIHPAVDLSGCCGAPSGQPRVGVDRREQECPSLIDPQPEVVAILRGVADLPMAGNQCDDLRGDQCGIDPFPEQAGSRGLGPQGQRVAFAAPVVLAGVWRHSGST